MDLLKTIAHGLCFGMALCLMFKAGAVMLLGNGLEASGFITAAGVWILAANSWGE
jgi:hypothetical protein